jgi:hypothetical protein
MHFTCITRKQNDARMRPDTRIDVRMRGIDPDDLSFAQGVAGVCQCQGAAATQIADFDYESRPRLPQDFLIESRNPAGFS